MKSSISILVVDDHALVREGLKRLLLLQPDFEVIGEASNGREAIEQADALLPDILLIDISMPKLNGLDATARIKRTHPDIHIIIISMYAHEEYVWQALQVGASGYLLKSASAEELTVAIRSVHQGGLFLSPTISKSVLDEISRRTDQSSKGLSPLTERQREILQLIAEGNTSKDIARSLDLSTKTVEAHRSQLMDRLDIHDIAGLVRYAIRVGLIEP